MHASIAEEFAQRLASAASSLRTGERHDPDAYFGPVNNAHQFSRVMSVIEGMPEHATVLTGGHRAADRGYFIEPTVVTGLRQDDDPSQKEIFGPVITIQTFETEQEALDCANGVEYGLASSVWTRDTSIAGRCVRDLDFGCVWVNTHIPIVAEMPHGGYKHSGYGKDLSMTGEQLGDAELVRLGLQVTWAVRSDIGKRRARNEDSAVCTGVLFSVADGVGGHAAGDLASAAVVEQFAAEHLSYPVSAEAVYGSLTRASESVARISAAAARDAGTTVTVPH